MVGGKARLAHVPRSSTMWVTCDLAQHVNMLSAILQNSQWILCD